MFSSDSVIRQRLNSPQPLVNGIRGPHKLWTSQHNNAETACKEGKCDDMRSSPLIITILLSLCGMSTQNGMHRPPPSSSPLSIDASRSVDPHLRYLSFDTSKFELIRQLPAGAQLRFDDFLDLNIDLELCVQQVLTHNAVVVTVAADGTQSEAQRPNVVHLSGVAHHDAASMILISLSPAGSTGFIRTAALSISIEAAPEAGRHSVLLEAPGTSLLSAHCVPQSVSNVCL